MARISFILAFALARLILRISADEEERYGENYHINTNIDSEGAGNQGPVEGPVFQNDQTLEAFQEKVRADRSEESRYLAGTVVENPPSFMVGLAVAKGRAFCTATLITKNRILTAASCFDNYTIKGAKKKFVAVLGLSDISPKSRKKNKKRGDVSIVKFNRAEVEISRGYYGGNISKQISDVAIVRLREDVNTTIHKPIAVYEEKGIRVGDYNFSKENTTLTGMGWGLKSCDEDADDVLRKVEAESVHTWARCKRHFEKVSPYDMCAFFNSGKNQTRLMPGDAGGPLYFSQLNTAETVQIGVSSANLLEKNGGCTNQSLWIPQLYSSMTNFMMFIRQNAPEARYCHHNWKKTLICH